MNRKRKFEASADGRGAEGDAENDPILICVAPHIGDVTGLEVGISLFPLKYYYELNLNH